MNCPNCNHPSDKHWSLARMCVVRDEDEQRCPCELNISDIKIATLLAALEETIQFVAKWANDNDSTIGHRAVARAEAAIAEARRDNSR